MQNPDTRVRIPSSPPVGAPATTRDAILDGRVVYEQPSRGYRVALEAPLLARFAIAGRTRPFSLVADLGAGAGAISLMLLVTGWARSATAIEEDRASADLATRNAAANGVSARLDVQVASVATSTHDVERRFDLVIANPPYFDPADGAVSPDPARATARALTTASIESFIRAGHRVLGRGGRLVLAFPAARLCALLEPLARAGLHPKRLRMVHPRIDAEAQVVFVEAKPGRPGGLAVEPPLAVRGAGEEYTPEVDDALRGRWPMPEEAARGGGSDSMSSGEGFRRGARSR